MVSIKYKNAKNIKMQGLTDRRREGFFVLESTGEKKRQKKEKKR